MLPLICSAAGTAQEQLNQAVSRYMKSSLTATFSYSGSMGKGSGTLKSSGKKFALETTAGSSWYNGVNMWTYSPSTKETTLVKPSASELAEANPLSVLSSSATAFTASFAPKQTKGKSTIVLTPRTKRSGIKRVVVVLNAADYKPIKIDVTTSDGSTTVLNIKSISTAQKHSDTTFAYPAKKYPKVKVIDLR